MMGVRGEIPSSQWGRSSMTEDERQQRLRDFLDGRRRAEARKGTLSAFRDRASKAASLKPRKVRA